MEGLLCITVFLGSGHSNFNIPFPGWETVKSFSSSATVDRAPNNIVRTVSAYVHTQTHARTHARTSSRVNMGMLFKSGGMRACLYVNTHTFGVVKPGWTGGRTLLVVSCARHTMCVRPACVRVHNVRALYACVLVYPCVHEVTCVCVYTVYYIHIGTRRKERETLYIMSTRRHA